MNLIELVDELVRIEVRAHEIRNTIENFTLHAEAREAEMSPSSPSTAPARKVRQVRANGRPAAVLALLRDVNAPVSLEAIALRSEWTREATSKVLSSMLASHLVDRTPDGDYVLPEVVIA